MSALDIVLDSVAMQMFLEKVNQRGCVQQRLGVTAFENSTKGEIYDPGKRITRL